MAVEVLPAEGDIRACGKFLGHQRNENKRGTECDLDRCALVDTRNDVRHQSRRFGASTIHLPVGGDQRAPCRCLHTLGFWQAKEMRAMLPMAARESNFLRPSPPVPSDGIELATP